MNGWLIVALGIVSTAGGSFLTYYGSQMIARRGRQATEEKIDALSERIEGLRVQPVVSSGEIDAVHKEFKELADRFGKARAERVLAFQERSLQASRRDLEVGVRWSNAYETFLGYLRNALEAYTGVAGSGTAVSLPPLPANLIINGREVRSYAGEVRFPSLTVWRINLNDAAQTIPFLHLQIFDGSGLNIGSVAFLPRATTVEILLTGDAAVHVQVPTTSVPVTEFDSVAKPLAVGLVEMEFSRPPKGGAPR